MRKTALFYLFVFLLFFLAGCAGDGESVGLSEQEENASSVPGETVSSWPDDRQDSEPEEQKDPEHLQIEGDESTVYRFIVSGYGAGDMSYEEYFSKERYIENLSDMGLGSLEWGGNHCSFFYPNVRGAGRNLSQPLADGKCLFL